VNAGTAEFLYEPISDQIYFMEMNTRLQVEHPVTEATTGLDLVRLQIAIARGEKLTGEPPSTRGHSIEVRLCAEDPDRGFAPAPGRVASLRAPLGPGLRTDTGIREGEQIPVEFDSMIAKVIAHGATREEARGRLCRSLREMQIVVERGRA
jgi:acetyl/propionyl-CoA carboxylase alpha subunit